ncbi:hypothetical protein [Aureimonas leprariae]|uniref:Uncharacterized protein n=1 Tax=Plantimonas leprariae TaxID=2615207 RepID=A0A7V7PNR3_9HYPH|nr:hypothetical protein [Aureimonas leprariae]KAB0679548.1 hypothetical protein F6X38_12040 [Aureimonas leprariae]
MSFPFFVPGVPVGHESDDLATLERLVRDRREVEPANAMLREEAAAFLKAKQAIAERGGSRRGQKVTGR